MRRPWRLGAALAPLLVSGLSVAAGAETPDVPSGARAADRLLERARHATPQRYRLDMDRGAQVQFTDDGRSFLVTWYPPSTDASVNPPMIVTLHGHSSWAFDEFFFWAPYAAQRGYGIMALQWWFGDGDGADDYYSPREIYPIIESALKARNAAPRTVLLHGFSRGASNVYAVTALDRASGSRYVAVTVANAGGASKDYPPNVEISSGRFGPHAFEGTRWVMYCGGRDEHPQRDGCPAMRRSAAWVEQFGGILELFMEDPSGGHGGFHRDPDHVNAALDVFGRLIRQRAFARAVPSDQPISSQE